MYKYLKFLIVILMPICASAKEVTIWFVNGSDFVIKYDVHIKTSISYERNVRVELVPSSAKEIIVEVSKHNRNMFMIIKNPIVIKSNNILSSKFIGKNPLEFKLGFSEDTEVKISPYVNIDRNLVICALSEIQTDVIESTDDSANNSLSKIIADFAGVTEIFLSLSQSHYQTYREIIF